MDIEIRSLSPELTDDYMYFFKNDAFADHKDWAGCCCLFFHWDSQLAASHKEFIKTAKQGDYSFNWDHAEKYVRNGTIKGYLAYLADRVVGWCNANDKQNYAALKAEVDPEIWTDDKDKKVKSVVCFTIAADMRRKGISTRLLERVCDDAREQGYEYVEAYPKVGCKDTYINYHGPESLYYKQGFVLYKEHEGQAVLRKYF